MSAALKAEASLMVDRLAQLGKRAGGRELASEVRNLYHRVDRALADDPSDETLADLGGALEMWTQVLASRNPRSPTISIRRNPQRTRRRTSMTAAQKRAFRKMRAGLARWRAKKRRGRAGTRARRSTSTRRRRLPPRTASGRFVSRARARVVRRRRGRITPALTRRRRRVARKRSTKHLRAARPIKRGQLVAGLVTRNPRTGRMEIMSNALVASNPRGGRRRRRRSSSSRRRRNPRRYYATTVNPRRRRRRRRNPGRVASNPGAGSMISRAKAAVPASIAAIAGGAVAGYLDAKLLPKSPIMQGAAKFALGLVGAGFLRNKPAVAGAWIGSTVGTIGYKVGVKMGGGLVANTKGEALMGLADMAAEDPALESMIADAQDIGDLVTAGELADGEVEIADIEDDEVADLINE